MSFVDQLQEDNTRLREQKKSDDAHYQELREEWEADRAEMRADIQQMRSVIETSIQQINRLRQKVTHLEQQRAADARRIEVLECLESQWKAYSQYLLKGIRELIKQVLELGQKKVVPAFDPKSAADYFLELERGP